MAASTTTNSFDGVFLRYKTRVSSTPAGPTMERPGSTITVKPSLPMRSLNCSMNSRIAGARSAA